MKIKKAIKNSFNFFDYLKIKNSKLFLNKDVFILGSAPNPDLKFYSKDKILVTCNASSANAHKLKLGDPALTIIDNELIDPNINLIKPSRSVIVKNKLLSNINLGNLISVQSNFSKGGLPEVLEAKYSTFSSININLRRMILQNTLSVNWIDENALSLASTGGFAIAFCAFLSARSITFEGFKLFQNEGNDLKHFYEEHKTMADNFNKENTKAHSLADSLIVGILSAKGISINTSERDFFPLLSNWGLPEFKYKKE